MMLLSQWRNNENIRPRSAKLQERLLTEEDEQQAQFLFVFERRNVEISIHLKNNGHITNQTHGTFQR